MKKQIETILKVAVISLTAFLCINFGSGPYKRGTVVKGPEFFKLKPGRPFFSGTIKDEKTSGDFRNIRFFDPTRGSSVSKEGDTKFDAYNKDDDSKTEIDLDKISEIEVTQQYIDSPRYSNQMFSLVRVIPNSGKPIENLLVPQDIEICAESDENNMTKSWLLHKINIISNVTIATKINEKEKSSWYPPASENDNTKQDTTFGKVKKEITKVKTGVQDFFGMDTSK